MRPKRAFGNRAIFVPMSGTADIDLRFGDGGNRPDPAIHALRGYTSSERAKPPLLDASRAPQAAPEPTPEQVIDRKFCDPHREFAHTRYGNGNGSFARVRMKASMAGHLERLL